VSPRYVNEQRAHTIQNADVIHNHPSGRVVDHRAAGARALQERRYAVASSHFDSVLDAGEARAGDWYYAALALLQGRRPLQHEKATVVEIDRRLCHAGASPEALVLRALVADDYSQSWRRYRSIPDSLVKLIDRLGDGRRREILSHVEAPESRVWKALRGGGA
jgi:hypothetical protein